MAEMLLPLTAALQLLVASPPAGPTVVAQAAGEVSLASATDRAASQLFATERARRMLVSEKARLRSVYNQQLAEIDRLKRGRASWRRDRQLKTQKAKSQETAVELARVDGQLRTLDRRLRTQRSRMVAAIDRELAVVSTSGRRAKLNRWRSTVRGEMTPRVKKIVLPDARLDELADPEELEEQIALIKQVEAELEREKTVLERRAQRYASMDALRRKRLRARDMAALDDDFVRRSTGRVDDGSTSGRGASNEGFGAGAADTDDAADPQAPGAGAETDEPPPGDLKTSSLILADVVDASTVDALKRAEQSANPATKLQAANRARAELLERLKNLHRSRERIEHHLRNLRAP